MTHRTVGSVIPFDIYRQHAVRRPARLLRDAGTVCAVRWAWLAAGSPGLGESCALAPLRVSIYIARCRLAFWKSFAFGMRFLGARALSCDV